MLVVDRTAESYKDAMFADFPSYLRQGDCLLLNDTRVFPARLHGRRNHSEGAEIELFLLWTLDREERTWHCLAKPAKRVRKGDVILLSETLSATVLEEHERGERTVQFDATAGSAEAPVQLGALGSVPLPPYIHRAPDETDRERYQTVFAEHRGSVAAPTAGLHFTPAILRQCEEAGADITRVTLHVGLGTFAPLPEGDLSQVQLHAERYYFPLSAARQTKRARRRICIGTTSVRTLETALLERSYKPMQGETTLFIQPGFQFRGTNAMLTNFHLPESSLLMLVSAFAGRELILDAYRHAVGERYRFFSYGDCMLIL